MNGTEENAEKTDVKTPTEKRIIDVLNKQPEDVEIENPAVTGVLPEGYVTGDEFRRLVKENLKRKFAEDGNL